MKKTALILLAIAIAANAVSLDSLISRRKQAGTFESLRKQLEAGKTEIDYLRFRDLYIESESFSKKSIESFSNWNKAARKCYKNDDFKCVVDNCVKMIESDYTSMIAHKMLVDAYAKLGDSAASRRHQQIEMGLLRSIVKSGDGKTCRTGWKVNQVEEEYFVINYALNMDFVSQSIYNQDGVCDLMVVKNETITDTVYFDITNVMKTYKF